MRDSSRSVITVRVIIVLAVFATSFSAILIRMSSAAPVVVAAWRMAIAAVMTAPFALARRRAQRVAPRVPLWPTIGAGVLLALHFAAWNSSLSRTSVAHATVLVTMHPLVILVFELIDPSHRVSASKLGAVAVAIGGGVVLASGGSVSGRVPTAAGDALAVVGAFAVAGYMILGTRVRRTASTAQYTVRVYTIAALGLLIWTIVTGEVLVPLPARDFAIFATLALVCTLLGHSVFSWAFRYVPASDVSVSILLEPIFASIMAVFFFSELPGPRTLLGAAIVVASLVYIALLERPRIESHD